MFNRQIWKTNLISQHFRKWNTVLLGVEIQTDSKCDIVTIDRVTKNLTVGVQDLRAFTEKYAMKFQHIVLKIFWKILRLQKVYWEMAKKDLLKIDALPKQIF